MKDSLYFLKTELHSDPAKAKEHLDWMHQYVKNGADMTHVAAGSALAASVLTASLLTQDRSVLQQLLTNPRAGQSGREDFRYAFAYHSLLKLTDSYAKDDLVQAEESLPAGGVQLLKILLESLAYETGALAEELGLHKSDL